jgi:hypothetical protein
MTPNPRHLPDPSEVLEHLTEIYMATLNPYFVWAIVLHCHTEELDLPHFALMHLASVAIGLIGEDEAGNRDPTWGANRDNRVSYERALRFDQQVKKLEQYNDLKEIGSDRAAKWFPDDMLRLMAEERQRLEKEERERRRKERRLKIKVGSRKCASSKDQIYRRIGERIGLSESTVKKRCLKAEKGEDFKRVLHRQVIDWY